MASSRESAPDKVGEVTYFWLKQHKPSSHLIYQHNFRRQIPDGFVVQNTGRSFVPEAHPQPSGEGAPASLGSLTAGGLLQLGAGCSVGRSEPARWERRLGTLCKLRRFISLIQQNVTVHNRKRVLVT